MFKKMNAFCICPEKGYGDDGKSLHQQDKAVCITHFSIDNGLRKEVRAGEGGLGAVLSIYRGESAYQTKWLTLGLIGNKE